MAAWMSVVVALAITSTFFWHGLHAMRVALLASVEASAAVVSP